jgi:CRP/FNR family transcriptional regulator, transcriptional activator FtrB
MGTEDLDAVKTSIPALENLPLLNSLSRSSRLQLLRHGVLHGVGPGTLLFEQGEMPTFQHVVVAGSVHLFGRSSAGREVLIEVVSPPDLVIPAAVVTGAPYLMRARVSEPSRLLLIEADAFRSAVAREPMLAQEVILSLAGQFRRLVRQIKNLKLRTASERVGCYLVALSQRQGTLHRAILPYEKNLIASELGITRESFSRALSALKSVGVTVRNDTISIRDRTRLAAACGLDPLIDGPEGLPYSHGTLVRKPSAKRKSRRAHG